MCCDYLIKAERGLFLFSSHLSRSQPPPSPRVLEVAGRFSQGKSQLGSRGNLAGDKNSLAVVAKAESFFEDLRSTYFQWEKRGLLCKIRTIEDHFISLVLMRTRSSIGNLFATTGLGRISNAFLSSTK